MGYLYPIILCCLIKYAMPFNISPLLSERKKTMVWVKNISWTGNMR